MSLSTEAQRPPHTCASRDRSPFKCISHTSDLSRSGPRTRVTDTLSGAHEDRVARAVRSHCTLMNTVHMVIVRPAHLTLLSYKSTSLVNPKGPRTSVAGTSPPWRAVPPPADGVSGLPAGRS